MKKRHSQFKKEEFRINELSFPDLVVKQSSSTGVPTNKNYLNKLVDTPSINIPKVEPMDTVANDYFVKQYEDMITNNLFVSMINRWDKYKETYTHTYGKDIFEKMFYFPNYDYDYYNKLDEKYQSQQAEFSHNTDEFDDDDLYDLDYDTYSF